MGPDALYRRQWCIEGLLQRQSYCATRSVFSLTIGRIPFCKHRWRGVCEIHTTVGIWNGAVCMIGGLWMTRSGLLGIHFIPTTLLYQRPDFIIRLYRNKLKSDEPWDQPRGSILLGTKETERVRAILRAWQWNRYTILHKSLYDEAVFADVAKV